MKKKTVLPLLTLFSLLGVFSGLTADEGVTEGILIAKGANNGWLDVRPDGTTDEGEILVPSDLVEAVSHLYTPNRVKVEWAKATGEDHPTATAVHNLRPAGDEGVVEGKVAAKFDDNWIDIKPDEGPLRRYVPRWIGGADGGNDQVAGNLIREAEVGSDVRATWVYDERVRLVTLEKLGGEPEPEPEPNKAPRLWEASVKPQQGLPDQEFTFEVLYRDEDGDAPSYVVLRLDDDEHGMEADGQGPEGSTWYRLKLTNLSSGPHRYSYKASDGDAVVDTDWRDGPDVAVVEPEPEPGMVKDARQVRTIGAHFAALDDAGALEVLFEGDPALNAAQRCIVEEEEAWILGA